MTLIENVREDLRNAADVATKESAQRFFKEYVRFYGVKNAMVHKISKQYTAQIKKMSKAEVFDLCEILWQSGIMEESLVACNWSYAMRKQFDAGDMKVFERWINSYVTNWASCDTFCNHTVGELVEMFPELVSQLNIWAISPNRWMRRAAAVSLIIPAKNGLFMSDIFQIASSLLQDPDDMVQKGYGWMLKVTCQHHEQQVFDFVMKNKALMPRTALRYAIEKMPSDLKQQAMAK